MSGQLTSLQTAMGEGLVKIGFRFIFIYLSLYLIPINKIGEEEMDCIIQSFEKIKVVKKKKLMC